MVKFMKEKLDSILKPRTILYVHGQTANKARKNIYYIRKPLQLP